MAHAVAALAIILVASTRSGGEGARIADGTREVA
jgi:hypothetical protein